ncbi:hypothetical protein LXL04_010159 [Taraxacum kok-saghyz]
MGKTRTEWGKPGQNCLNPDGPLKPRNGPDLNPDRYFYPDNYFNSRMPIVMKRIAQGGVRSSLKVFKSEGQRGCRFESRERSSGPWRQAGKVLVSILDRLFHARRCLTRSGRDKQKNQIRWVLIWLVCWVKENGINRSFVFLTGGGGFLELVGSEKVGAYRRVTGIKELEKLEERRCQKKLGKDQTKNGQEKA